MKSEFIAKLKEQVKNLNKKIVFPEGEEDRVLEAAKILINQGIVKPILIGDSEKIRWRLGELGFDAEIKDPNKEDIEKYAQQFFELRKHKGVTIEKAREIVKKPSYFGTMMLQNNEVDGLVSGSTHTTADTLRPALQIIKTKKGIRLASSFFFMIVNGKTFMFADCGFNIKPNSQELSEIAYSTVLSAKFFNVEPKVAFLSFSTKGSANHEDVLKVQKAVKLFTEKNPGCVYDGELQLDAALVPEVAEKKAPNSPLKGDANVLIFPDLGSGNIGYKLVQRIAGALAIGPIVQGLKKPINDLSRGCSVEDIVEVATITAIQSEGE